MENMTAAKQTNVNLERLDSSIKKFSEDSTGLAKSMRIIMWLQLVVMILQAVVVIN